jgi:MFS family permease
MARNLATAVAVQFGGHFAKNIAPLKTFFSEDPSWVIQAGEWASFQSAVTLPSVLFPWFMGRSVDSKSLQTKTLLTLALAVTCIGEMMFVFAVKDHLLTMALIGRFVFGMGEGLVSSLTGYIAAIYFPGHRMLSLGITQSFHSIAVAVSKASLAPIANHYGDYLGALSWSLFACAGSLICGLLWYAPPDARVRQQRAQECKQVFVGDRGTNMPLEFWLVAGMHLLFSSAHRLFGHIDAAYFRHQYGQSASGAGMASSITEFVAVAVSPLLGALLDKHCTVHTLPKILLFTALLGSAGYALLGEGSGGPSTIALVMIGVVNGISPTVMKSVIPECVPLESMATAFGVYESSEAFGIVVGSLFVGEIATIAHDDYSSVVPMFSGLLLIAAGLASVLIYRRRNLSYQPESSALLSAYVTCPAGPNDQIA